MMTSEQETTCTRASVYYYDFLCGNKAGDIPEALWRHIDGCAHCRSEVQRLDAAIGGAGAAGPDLAAATGNLQLHMAYLGQSVDCTTVRPFLAPMADPRFEVRATTPITAHLKECPACADDLSAVGRMGLTSAQLCRFGAMLAEAGDNDPAMCGAAAQAVGQVAALDFEDVDAAVLRHICICPDCRAMLFAHRQRLCDALPAQHGHNGTSCEAVTSSQLFDLCLPSGAAGLASPVSAHAVSCRRCMDRMQALLHTVTQIMDRPNSGIATCLTLADLSRMRRVGFRAEPSRRPAERLQPEAQRSQTSARRRAAAMLRPFLKPAAAAAGILLVAMLAFHGTSLKATDLSEVYARLAEVNTMHLKKINPENAEVVQEIWISRNTKIFKDGGQYVIWDLDGKAKTVANVVTGERETVRLDNEDIERTAATLIGPMHILPFVKFSRIPQDAVWHRLPEPPADAAMGGMNIYEMVWMDKSSGGAPVYRKWRAYVQPETKLPVRTEHYSKPNAEADYERLLISEIAYPDAASVQEMLRQIGL